MLEDADPRRRAGATKRERTRKSLIEAARLEMNEKPWQDVQMKDIAKRAGVGAATIYQHFPNKRSLIGEAYAEFFVRLRQNLDSDLERLPALEAARNVVASLARHVRSMPWLTINIMTATREQTVQTLLGSGRDPDEIDILSLVPFSSLLIDCLRQAQKQHEVGPRLPVEQVGTYHTNGLLLRLFFDPEESAEDTTALVLSQLLPVLEASREDQRRPS